MTCCAGYSAPPTDNGVMPADANLPIADSKSANVVGTVMPWSANISLL